MGTLGRVMRCQNKMADFAPSGGYNSGVGRVMSVSKLPLS